MEALAVQEVSDVPAVKIWKGQRVVTLKDIDEVHQRPSGTARKRFNENKKHFIKDIDYFVLKTDEAKESFNIKAPRGLTILSESGYLMVVKPFQDDLSWDVQRRLVIGYFRGRELEDQQKQINSQKPLEDYEIRFIPDPRQWYEIQKEKMNTICDSLGWDRKYLNHKILVALGEIYDIEFFKEAYKSRTGNETKYIMDVVEYFPDLQRDAEKTINFWYDLSC